MQQRARAERAPRGSAGEGGADQTEVYIPRARFARDHWPDVELGKDQRGWLKRIERGARVARRVERQIVGEVDVERTRERRRARRKMRVSDLRVRSAGTRQLQHRARLQSLADGRRVHPEQGTTRVPLGGSPSPIPRANAAARAERSEHFGVTVRRDERRSASDLGQRAIPELDWKAHVMVGEASRYYLPFAASAASSAPATSASALASFVAPTMNVGVELAPTLRARS